MPDGIFYWALGVLPLALLLKKPLDYVAKFAIGADLVFYGARNGL
jgi:hypothetical protein